MEQGNVAVDVNGFCFFDPLKLLFVWLHKCGIVTEWKLHKQKL